MKPGGVNQGSLLYQHTKFHDFMSYGLGYRWKNVWASALKSRFSIHSYGEKSTGKTGITGERQGVSKSCIQATILPSGRTRERWNGVFSSKSLGQVRETKVGVKIN